MSRYFRRLAALIGASLTPSADAMVVLKEPQPAPDDSPNAVSILNEAISPELLQHRSHSSHGSHSSHRSSSGGGRRAVPQPVYPAPAPAEPPVEREPSPPRTSDPLGQDPRPQQSVPEPSKRKSVNNLDPEALKNVVLRMQLALQFEGYYDGPIDGVMGQKTRDAVKRFKRAKGISGDTVFDTQTLNALGVVGF